MFTTLLFDKKLPYFNFYGCYDISETGLLATAKNLVDIWDLQNENKHVTTLSLPQNHHAISLVVFSKNHNIPLLATANALGDIVVWDIYNKHPIVSKRILAKYSKSVCHIANLSFDRQNTKLYVAIYKTKYYEPFNTLKLNVIDLTSEPSGDQTIYFQTNSISPINLVYNATHTLLYASNITTHTDTHPDNSGTICVWNVEFGILMNSLESDEYGAVSDVATCEDGQLACAFLTKNKIRLWDSDPHAKPTTITCEVPLFFVRYIRPGLLIGCSSGTPTARSHSTVVCTYDTVTGATIHSVTLSSSIGDLSIRGLVFSASHFPLPTIFHTYIKKPQTSVAQLAFKVGRFVAHPLERKHGSAGDNQYLASDYDTIKL